MFEVEFQLVGDGEKSGDAITVRFTDPESGQFVVGIIDAGFTETGDRIVECLLGNGLICTQLNNARTNSMVQSPDVPNPAWGDQSSDRLGYDGSGRMICKRVLAGGISGDTGAYNNPQSVVGFTTFYDPSGNKLYERALHAESRSSLYSNDLLNRLLQYQRALNVAGTVASACQLEVSRSDGACFFKKL